MGNKEKSNTKIFNFFKWILVINVCIILVFLLLLMRNFIILNELAEKGKISSIEENLYTKRILINKDQIWRTEKYFLDNKALIKNVCIEIDSGNVIYNMISYYEGEKQIDYFVSDDDEKVYTISNTKGVDKLFEDVTYRKVLSFENLWHLIKSCAAARIKNVKCNGIDCYKISGKCLGLENNEGELYWYIDKETGLFVREYGRNSVKNDIENGTDIYNMLEDYTYEFGCVTEENFVIPNVEEYKFFED